MVNIEGQQPWVEDRKREFEAAVAQAVHLNAEGMNAPATRYHLRNPHDTSRGYAYEVRAFRVDRPHVLHWPWSRGTWFVPDNAYIILQKRGSWVGEDEYGDWMEDDIFEKLYQEDEDSVAMEEFPLEDIES